MYVHVNRSFVYFISAHGCTFNEPLYTVIATSCPPMTKISVGESNAEMFHAKLSGRSLMCTQVLCSVQDIYTLLFGIMLSEFFQTS